MVQTTAAGGVSWEVVEEQAAASAPKEKKKKKQMTVKVPKWCGKWVVSMDDFKEGIVGAKSKNIAGDFVKLYLTRHMLVILSTAEGCCPQNSHQRLSGACMSVLLWLSATSKGTSRGCTWMSLPVWLSVTTKGTSRESTSRESIMSSAQLNHCLVHVGRERLSRA